MILLTTVAAVVLSQVPQVECVSAYGETRCPRTPFGKCVASYGKIFCGDPAPEAFTPYENPPQVDCLTAYGTGACGYDCKAAYGKIACAKTPWGRCITQNGEITCGDPSGPSRSGQRVSCVSGYGVEACGYDCKSAYGQVACAKTEFGRCIAVYGQIFCGDPAPWACRQANLEPVRCLAAYGTAACGYDCKAAYGTVMCSSSPWGRCVTQYGKITCSN